MVTHEEFSVLSSTQVDDFERVSARSEELLALLCGDRWEEDSPVCKKAVIYQIEYIALNGGFEQWGKGAGAVGSHSFSVGGESESYTYIRSTPSENARVYNGYAISPLAWGLLSRNGFLKTLRSVRVL